MEIMSILEVYTEQGARLKSDRFGMEITTLHHWYSVTDGLKSDRFGMEIR